MEYLTLKFQAIKIRNSKFEIFISLCFVIFSLPIYAQSNIDSVLATIAKNNTTLASNIQFWETQKLEFKTGLLPRNPQFNYDYMAGSPSTAGNQTDITFVQAFDFPTSYKKKKQVSKLQTGQAEFQSKETRQDILFHAKNICLELVYRNKLHQQITLRRQNSEKLLSVYKIKLDKGDGTILEVNKIQIQLIEIRKNFQQNYSAINRLNQKLAALNGGREIIFTDTVYPIYAMLPAFEQLENEIENNDPKLKQLEQEKLVAQKQIELTRALSFPKLETGYHYQGILGQKFQGVHLGITIPLWENKNTLKTEQARLHFKELLLQEHRNEHYYEIKQLYEKYINLKITLKEYQTVFSSLNNIDLLNKALSFGQISSIEYFLELGFYYEAYDDFLETEKEYHQVISELYKYKL